MKKNILFFFALTSICLTNAQPSIQWQKCLGGSRGEQAFSVQQTNDSGYIVAGYTESNDSDVSGNHNMLSDFWIVKLTGTGTIQWQKCFGGSNPDGANSIQQTIDGGYIVAGYTGSNDSDVSGLHGSYDFWIVKLTATGNMQWQKCLGGSSDDKALSIKQTADTGFIVAGYTTSNDSDVSGNHGGIDFWIVKLSATGAIQWQKCLGGSGNDIANGIQQTTDGGYIAAGGTSSADGDVTGIHGGSDFWVVKLSATGNIQWQKCYGGSDTEEASSIQQTQDGGYIVAGKAKSYDGDVSGFHGGYADYWVVKLNGSGALQWQQCFGGSYLEEAYFIQQTTDGGFIITGGSSSTDGDVTGNHSNTGYEDFWVVKLTDTGALQWQKCLGGSDYEYAHCVKQTNDGGYITVGMTQSNDGDVSGLRGNYDMWVVKLSPLESVEENSSSTWQIFPNPSNGHFTILSSQFSVSTTLDIYNLLGGKMYSTVFKDQQKTIDWKLNEGIYFVQLTVGQQTFSKKIIIESN